MAVNFMGLDDVDMTRGDQGVRQAFHEVARVLRPRGYFCFTIIPPEEAETPAQRLEAEVYAHACGAKWLPAIRYQEYLRGAGFTLVKREALYTGKKLRADRGAPRDPDRDREREEPRCRTPPLRGGLEEVRQGYRGERPRPRLTCRPHDS